MNEKEHIEEVLRILRDLPHVTAYNGSLKELRQGSYIPMNEITKVINEYERKKRKI